MAQNMETKKAFGRFIKAELERHEISQKDMCVLTGMTQSMMSGYMNGKKMPFLSGLKKICEAFDENYIIVACVFSYTEYRKPDYWLGSDYKKNEDYLRVWKMAYESADEGKKPERKRAWPRPSQMALYDTCKKLEQPDYIPTAVEVEPEPTKEDGESGDAFTVFLKKELNKIGYEKSVDVEIRDTFNGSIVVEIRSGVSGVSSEFLAKDLAKQLYEAVWAETRKFMEEYV